VPVRWGFISAFSSLSSSNAGRSKSTWKPLNTNHASAQHGAQPAEAPQQGRPNILTFRSFEPIVSVPVNTKWPTHFPGGCPPSDAASARGLVYRIVANTPPRPEEFLSAYERNPTKYTEDCKARGLSVHSDRTELQRLLRTVPAMKNLGKYVASAILEPPHGELKPTPTGNSKSHCTWWVSSGTEPWTLFRIVGA